MGREYNSYGRDQITFEQVGRDVNIHPVPPLPRSREEQILLEAVESVVESRLDQSLHQDVFLNLAKESQPEQVYRPWQQEIQIGIKPPTPIPPDQTIDQVFSSDEINGKLLILGKPGAGKTTTLLDLAKGLIERAYSDPRQPIPVILNLSSWKGKKTSWKGKEQTIREWIIAELKPKYGVNIELGQVWLKERKILPLLDGLDEVESKRQISCVTHINDFLSEENFPLELVVCSRLKEYENLHIQLHVNGAIYLKELTDDQIQNYLIQLNRSQLWQMIGKSKNLLDLVRSPLLLSMAILTYPQESNSQLAHLQRARDPLQLLLDGYIERMLHRQFESRFYRQQKAPSHQEVKRRLIWLACQMQYSQSEFLIEEMQPFFLPANQKWKYRLMIGLIFGLLYGLMFGIPSNLAIGLGVGFSGILMGDLASLRNIKTIEAVKWSWRGGRALIVATILGTVISLMYSFISLPRLGVTNYLFLSLMSGLAIGVFAGLNEGLKSKAIKTKSQPNQGIKRSAKFFLFSELIAIPIGGIWGGLLTIVSRDLMNILINSPIGIFINWNPDLLVNVICGGLICGMISGINFGGLACLQHFTLRLLLYCNHSIPWDYARFLNYATERRFLQRIGGGYRFIHEYLQDHFAHMPLEQVADLQSVIVHSGSEEGGN